MAPIDYTQMVKYDVERGLLNSRRAVLSARLSHERNSAQPDPRVISGLQAEMRAVAALIRQLSPPLEPGR